MLKIMKRGFAGLMIAGLLNTQIQAASSAASSTALGPDAASAARVATYVPSEHELYRITSFKEGAGAGTLGPVDCHQVLTHAASSGYQAEVDYIVGTHADKLSDYTIKMALYGAAESGRLAIVKRLCQIPGELKPTQEAIASALSRASNRRQTDVVKYLLALEPDQAAINNALTGCISDSFSDPSAQSGVSFLLGVLPVDQQGIKQTFFAALRANYLGLATFLMAPEKGLTLGQQDVNTAFVEQAKRVHWSNAEPLQFLMQLQGYPQPDQAGINQAFLAVTSMEKKNLPHGNDLKTTMRILLSGTVKPDEATMNASLRAAAQQGHEDALKLLLDQPEGQPRPDQATVNAVLLEAIRQPNISRDLWNILLSKTRVLKPEQTAVNEAFLACLRAGTGDYGDAYLVTENMGPDLPCLETVMADAVLRGTRGTVLEYLYHKVYTKSLVDGVVDADLKRALTNTLQRITPEDLQMFKRLVSLTDGMSADNRARILNMYRDIADEFTGIVDRARDNAALQAMDHASPEYYEALRANLELPVYTYVGVGAPHAHVPGVAFEVHAYANTQVTVPTAGAGVGAPTTGTLTDVVQAHMAARITDSETPLAEYAVAQDAVLAWIDGNIETTARDSAKLAIHHGLGVVGADRELQNAYTFVTAFHPKALDVWMNGFVTESITAYINRDNQTSCVKGISERIITGLRGVDSALDSIFAQPEAIAHAKTLISLLNPSDPGKLAWIVNSLRDLGVTPESSAAEAMARFKTFLLEKLGEHGLSAANMAEYTSDVESGIALSLEEYYYSHIKPALASASAGTASVAGAGVASL